MKRRTVPLGILTFSLAVVILATGVVPALAVTTHVEYSTAQGACIINDPDHPNILVIGQHFEYGDFYEGSADRIQLMVSAAPSGIGPPFKYVSAYEDNPERFAFSQEVDSGMETSRHLVKDKQIEIVRTDKTVLVHWKVALVIPATSASADGPATPKVTLPPGCLVIQGYGTVTPKTRTSAYGLWTLNEVYDSYAATATILCLGWQNFGPGSTPSIRTTATFTWTGP